MDHEQIKQEVEAEAQAEAAEYRKEIDKAGGNGHAHFSAEQLQEALHRNQVGDAELLIQLAMDQFAQDKATGIWYEFASHYWQEDVLGSIERQVERVASEYEHGPASRHTCL